MYVSNLLFIIIICCVVGSQGDWVSDWMSPVHEILSDSQDRRSKLEGYKIFDAGEPQTSNRIASSIHVEEPQRNPVEMITNDDATLGLKVKLENTLQTAEEMSQTLRQQIMGLVAKETRLKDAIANGRSGVTTVTVQTMNQTPRTYIVREGNWYLCQGVVQKPTERSSSPGGLLSSMFRAPRCIGKEMASEQDPCAFNSLIKYETVPQQRRAEYTEDQFLCLKSSFNSSLERFMSVPRHVVNDTCNTGLVRNIDENISQCSLRIMSEYTFYPEHSSAAAQLPLEYCTERDGSCRLIVAWHISNSTIENFEFLKNEYNFKKYFLKPDAVKHTE